MDQFGLFKKFYHFGLFINDGLGLIQNERFLDDQEIELYVEEPFILNKRRGHVSKFKTHGGSQVIDLLFNKVNVIKIKNNELAL